MTSNLDGWTSIHGVKMPRIIYGTAWKKEKTAGLVEQALKLGFRAIDTACQPKHYDEAGVGNGLAAALQSGIQRQDVYLQSKFTPLPGHDPGHVPYDPHAGLAQQVVQSFERSQVNLRTEHLDCLVLHSPLANPADLRDVWHAMEGLFDQGKVRQLGLSNCYDPVLLRHLYDSVRIKPAVVQNRFTARTGYDRSIRDFCCKCGLFYQSFWTLTANPAILTHDAVTALVDKYDRTAPQIFFRYLSQIEIIPLTGTTSAVHMRQDLDIARFELDPADCRTLAAVIDG